MSREGEEARLSLVDVTRDGAVCVLTLRREEKLNALSTALERVAALPQPTLSAIAGDCPGGVLFSQTQDARGR
jgi:hypothetical protein